MAQKKKATAESASPPSGVCSICKKPYTGWGNNARPVNDGRCCDGCNWTAVIPARIAILREEKRDG